MVTVERGIEKNGDGGETRVRIAIIGTGFAGLGMAIRLKREGITDFVALERAGSVGGTWRDNTYPGCACDVPSHLYSFSFATNPDWSYSFSRQPEIRQYLEDTAERQGLLPQIRFDSEVTEARWDQATATWLLQTPKGPVRSDVLITAIGGLIDPKLPDIPGIDGFEGEIFHSARWNHDYDLAGKRVAAIGTGASSIQFVPQIQPEVETLHLFQRTPAWITPRADRRFSSFEKRMMKRFPLLQQAARAGIFWSRETLVLGFIKQPRLMKLVERVARRHLKRQVPDPDLRAKLTPDYTIGCKRILVSNDFYPSLGKDNVELLTEGLAEIRGNVVIGSDGSEREVDAVILGTGFQVTDFPGAKVLFGRDGRCLGEEWDGSPAAHRCTTVAGYPNLFVLGGPNIGIGHTSAVAMFESQFNYVLDALATMKREGAATVEARPEVQERFIAELDRKMAKTVWSQGGCASWYVDRKGRNSTLWPDWTFEFAKQTREFDIAEYEVQRSADGERDEELVAA